MTYAPSVELLHEKRLVDNGEHRMYVSEVQIEQSFLLLYRRQLHGYVLFLQEILRTTGSMGPNSCHGKSPGKGVKIE
jgi:hypothetical protein